MQNVAKYGNVDDIGGLRMSLCLAEFTNIYYRVWGRRTVSLYSRSFVGKLARGEEADFLTH